MNVRIKKIVRSLISSVAIVLFVTVTSVGMFAVSSPTTFADAPKDDGSGVGGEYKGKCWGRILGFPQWSNGLPCGSDGAPRPETLNDIWIIGVNIAEVLVLAGGYVATGFIIWGGFTYIRSQGDPGKVTEAKSTLLNAVIGLVIVLASVAIINLVRSALLG